MYELLLPCNVVWKCDRIQMPQKATQQITNVTKRKCKGTQLKQNNNAMKYRLKWPPVRKV